MKLKRFEDVTQLVKQNFEILGMQEASIFPQARKIRNESLDFVDGSIDYDEIEDEAFGNVIDGLSREN